MNSAQYFVGVDLGQTRNFTTVAAVERLGSGKLTGRNNRKLSLRHLERPPLGTPYPEIVERVREMTERMALRGRCHLIVDGTGVGAPVIDMLRIARLHCRVWPVMITSGKQEAAAQGHYLVPKRDLIVGLQVLLRQGGLRIARGMKFRPALVEELADMQVRISPNGSEQFGARRKGKHDDLVLAVAMACWGVRTINP